MSALTSRHAPVLDTAGYPKRWSDYVGQEPAKKMLQVAVKSARIRRQPLSHVLIAHPSPGIGKTALAVLLATELKRPVRVTTGPVGKDLARLLLADMADGDVWFIDEAHALMDAGRRNAEWWLNFLQDGVIQGPLGLETQPKVTVIFATTEPEKLLPAIVSRFPIRPLLGDYTVEEAAKIAQKMDGLLTDIGLPKLSPADALTIASAADCNPRQIQALLENLRDLTLVGEIAAPPRSRGAYAVADMLRFRGLTVDGLTIEAQLYLRVLASEFGGKAGARNMQDRLQLPTGVREVENLLTKKGLIAKTPSGRTLTREGIVRVRELETEMEDAA